MEILMDLEVGKDHPMLCASVVNNSFIFISTATQVGIALPKWIVEKQNSIWVFIRYC